MEDIEKKMFIDDMQFAKIVNTADGPAIRIGSEIINIASSNPKMHVEEIVNKLRSGKETCEIPKE